MKSYIPIWVLLLLAINSLNGQNTTYHFSHLNTHDGLSQSSVIDIAQDQFGRMWFATRDGLNVYDGNKFKAYRNSVSDSTSISNSDILSVIEDKEGYMWIGTYNGLNRYNPIKDEFTRYFHNKSEHSLSNNTVWCIKEVANGEIWIGTRNGLSILRKDEDKISNYYSDESSSSLPSNYILSIAQSTNGNIWVGTSGGFCKAYYNKDGKLQFERFRPEDINVTPFIQDIVSCDQNTLCIGTKNVGLLKFDVLSERFLSIVDSDKDRDVRAIEIGDPGTLWVGTSDGITLIESDGRVNKLKNNTKESGSISHNYIKSIYKDDKGSIWVGSYYGGIDIWDRSNTNFINFIDQSAENQLGYKVVSSIVADSQENIYFGTEGRGITIFKKNTPQAEYVNLTRYPELLSNNIKSIYTDNTLLWIGTFDKGLSVFNLQKQRFENEIISKDLKDKLGNSGVYTIQKGSDNYLWIGSFGNGLFHYNPTSKTYQQFFKVENEGRGLSSNRVRSLLIDNSSNIWIGTQNGLNFLPFSNGSYDVQNISHFYYDQSTGSGDDILSIFQDLAGTIWIGLRAKGLARFDGNEFQHISLNSDQPITSIYSILEGKDGILWLGSNQGLIKYEMEDQSFKVYTQKDGLANNEFTNGASIKVGDSEFYFGGTEGVSFFNAELITQNNFSPQVLLTDLKIKNDLISPGDQTDILESSLLYTKEITLNYDESNFSIEYAIPNYINPSSNRFQYRVLGLDESWTITNQPQASFTIQRPGTYTFEVKGANNDGVWNEAPTRLKIHVKPPFWRSTWAYILYSLLLLIAIWGINKAVRSKTQLEHKLQLEHLENVRNKEVNDAKLRFFTNISHEFRTPLTLITGPLQQLLADYKGSSFVYKQLLVIESNANHLLQLINRLMDFRKLEHKNLQLEAAEGNIVKFSEEVFLSFTEYAKCNGYTYEFKKEEDRILVYYDRPKLEQVLYNLISNAFKYTPPGGIISVVIRKEADNVVIEVADTGPGIAPQFRDKVFERFFEIPEYKGSQNAQNTGTGIGLSIAKRIVNLHNGTIEIHSNAKSGSIFTVKLALGKEHLSEDQILQDYKFSDDLGLYTSQIPKINLDRPLNINEQILEQEKETILLVEDNAPLRIFMKDLLSEQYNILEAGDGREGMNKALQHIPDLIISDVMMPIMVGTELCAQIKSNLKTSHIPVVLLTSRTSLLYKVEGLESGADDYISKPFDVKEFQLRIRNLIQSTQRMRTKFSETDSFSPNKIAITSIDEELLKRAIQIVEENISNHQFDIATFCTQLGVSRTLLFTKIKAWTNFTPNDFIQEMRMKRAIQLLEQDKLNVSEISYEVGFRNPKYFSKVFTKKFGLSPTGYKEKFSQNFYQ